MFTKQITQLDVGQVAPLHVQRVAQDGPAHWRRIGTITRTATHLRVVFDAPAAGMLPVWDACVTRTADAPGVRVRFAIPRARGGMAIIATGSAPRSAFPRPPRRGRGLGFTGGPRRPRTAWPAV